MLGYINLDVNNAIANSKDLPRKEYSVLFIDPLTGNLIIRKSDNTENVSTIQSNSFLIPESMVFENELELLEYSTNNTIINGTLVYVKPDSIKVFVSGEGWNDTSVILKGDQGKDGVSGEQGIQGEHGDPTTIINDFLPSPIRTFSSSKIDSEFNSLSTRIDYKPTELDMNIYYLLLDGSTSIYDIGTWKLQIEDGDIHFKKLTAPQIWEDNGTLTSKIDKAYHNTTDGIVYLLCEDVNNPVFGNFRFNVIDNITSLQRYNGNVWVSIQSLGDFKINRLILDPNHGYSNQGIIGFEEQSGGTTNNIFRKTTSGYGYEYGSVYKDMWLTAYGKRYLNFAFYKEIYSDNFNENATTRLTGKEFKYRFVFNNNNIHKSTQIAYMFFDVDIETSVRLQITDLKHNRVIYETTSEIDFNAGLSDKTTIGWTSYQLNFTFFMISKIEYEFKISFFDEVNIVGNESLSTNDDLKFDLSGYVVTEHAPIFENKWYPDRTYYKNGAVCYEGERYLANETGIQVGSWSDNISKWKKTSVILSEIVSEFEKVGQPSGTATLDITGKLEDTQKPTYNKTDIGLDNIENYNISDSYELNDLESYASSKAVYNLGIKIINKDYDIMQNNHIVTQLEFNNIEYLTVVNNNEVTYIKNKIDNVVISSDLVDSFGNSILVDSKWYLDEFNVKQNIDHFGLFFNGSDANFFTLPSDYTSIGNNKYCFIMVLAPIKVFGDREIAILGTNNTQEGNNMNNLSYITDSSDPLKFKIMNSWGDSSYVSSLYGTSNQPNIVISYYNGNARKVRINGVADPVSETTINRITENVETLLGRDGSNDLEIDDYYRGTLYDFSIINNDIPNVEEMEKIEGYLANKWNINHLLPFTHKYRVNIPQKN